MRKGGGVAVWENLAPPAPPRARAVDPHLILADPDPGVLLSAVSDPAAFLMRIQIQLLF